MITTSLGQFTELETASPPVQVFPGQTVIDVVLKDFRKSPGAQSGGGRAETIQPAMPAIGSHL
jgi:hypothetical protein